MIRTEYSFHFVYSCGLVERGFVSQFRGLTDSFDSSAWNTPLSRLSVSRACCTASLLARAGYSVYVSVCIQVLCTHYCAPPSPGDNHQAMPVCYALRMPLASSHHALLRLPYHHTYAPPPWWMRVRVYMMIRWLLCTRLFIRRCHTQSGVRRRAPY